MVVSDALCISMQNLLHSNSISIGPSGKVESNYVFLLCISMQHLLHSNSISIGNAFTKCTQMYTNEQDAFTNICNAFSHYGVSRGECFVCF